MTDVAFVDDDESLRTANVQTLRLAGFNVVPYASASAVLEDVDAEFAGVVVTDVRMPRTDGLELFRRLQRIDAEIPVILITGHGDIAMAVDAMREGAYDFLAKPYASDRLLGSIRRALDMRRLVLENRALRRAAAAASGDGPLIGFDPSIERLRNTLRQIADTDVDVLIEGETGSGKDVAANALHCWSRRASRPLVAVNCGALPETMIESELFGHEPGAFTGAVKKRVGRIEHAHGGTLFLDEIEAMSPALQVKLLRVLEARQITPLGTNEIRNVDIRIVAATKIDLLTLVKQGRFREDLYYRLAEIVVKIPSLAERSGDAVLLARHFVNRFSRELNQAVQALSADAVEAIDGYAWPGNVRELENRIKRAVIMADGKCVTAADLDLSESADEEPQPINLRAAREIADRKAIRQAMSRTENNISGAAKLLGVSRPTLYDLLKQYRLQA
jgi:two-component system C4-dicarboxylate transport response regulator DctD